MSDGTPKLQTRPFRSLLQLLVSEADEPALGKQGRCAEAVGVEGSEGWGMVDLLDLYSALPVAFSGPARARNRFGVGHA